MLQKSKLILGAASLFITYSVCGERLIEVCLIAHPNVLALDVCEFRIVQANAQLGASISSQGLGDGKVWWLIKVVGDHSFEQLKAAYVRSMGNKSACIQVREI